MQIQNINNTNFQGGFRFRNINPEMRSNIESVAKRGKQIFDNFEKQGDTFVVVRDEYDKRIFKLISDFSKISDLKFEYYPLINTKCGLDNEMPEVLSSQLEGMKPVEIKPEEFLINLEKKASKAQPAPQKQSYTKNILRKLGVNPDTATIKTKNGCKKVTDADKTLLIYISPADEKNMHYVRVEKLISTSSNEDCRRYKMTADGEFTDSSFTGELGRMLFNEAFQAAVKFKS